MGIPVEQLYEKHFVSLYRFAVGLVGDVDEAHDIVQTVFLRLTKRNTSALTAPITKAYLFMAVRNGAKDLWKRKKAIPLSTLVVEDQLGEVFEKEIPDERPSLLEQAVTNEVRASVLKALQTLTVEQREILSLKYFSGLSTQEIAASLEKNENAIRQMEFRALRILRRNLNQEKLYE